MVHKTITKALLSAGLALGVSTLATAADKPATMTGASADMLSHTCAGCHGTNGASSGPATPTIGGLSTEYFVEVMQGFKSGDIKSTIMQRIAKGYSDEEITLMADWFGAKPYVMAKQDFDASLVEKGAKLHDKYCEKCHADGGTSKEDDSGLLAGQWVPYMRWAMDDFQAGDREMPKKMKKKVKKLVSKEGDAGIEALLNYYASQQ